LGRVDAGRVFYAGVFPGDKNGIGEFFDVRCQPSIIVRGELKVLPLLRVPHLWLTVRTRGGPGAGAGGWPWRWGAGARWAGSQGKQNKSRGKARAA